MPAIQGKSAVLSGSCSAATLGQVEAFAANRPALALDPLALADNAGLVDEALGWARARIDDGPVLIYASAPPDAVAAVQGRLGREAAGTLIENAMARIAGASSRAGRRLVVAGGETSGAVVGALGTGLRIGAQIDPGVPGTVTVDDPSLALALKSGNFGGPGFFEKALAAMP